MTNLFQCLKPAQKFRISIRDLAKLLKIPQHLIVRVECWAYVVFVHRRDVGGQFISMLALKAIERSSAPEAISLYASAERSRFLAPSVKLG
ncbi:MAG: hypothetical protein F6K09_24895 [Merismopedia sp. SIO2A8]|nr:hypothetical protein [Symploca sp. SIO2B6]NET51817.1 hypothetical protein [Merismopedia sp. SIO2A8]